MSASTSSPRRFLLIACLLVGALVLGSLPATGAVGDLDPTFGTGGKVIKQFNVDADEEVAAAAVQPDGKIVVAVYDSDNDAGIVVARFGRNGSLDNTFSGNGWIPINIETSDTTYPEEPVGIAVRPDGKIVVGGYASIATAPDYHWVAVRLRPGGTLDTSFDGDGRAVFDLDTSGCCPQPAAMTLQPDGKIVLAGFAAGTGIQDIGVVRLNANGSPDTGFGSGGVKIFSTGLFAGSAEAVRVFDRKIYVAGRSWTGDDELLLARLRPGGALDNTFGTGGVVTDDWRTGGDGAEDMIVLPNGKVVVAGNSASDALVARYKPNGDRDTTFGSGGAVYPRWYTAGDPEIANAVALHPTNSIVVAGRANDGTNYDFGAFRLRMGGGFDRSFSSDGKKIVDMAPGHDNVAFALVLQGEKIVLVGQLTNDALSPDNATGLARLKGRANSTTTLKVGKTVDRLVAKGRVKPNHRGKKVKVTLYKRSNGSFRKLNAKNVTLSGRSRYSTGFARPSAGRCRITTVFPGDAHHLPSRATKTFAC